MKKTNLLITLVSMLCLCACGGQSKQNAQEMSADSIEQPLVGGSRDAHGCLASAGYIWSEVRKDCVRLFEEGIRLEDTAGVPCFIVFSQDSTQAELFFYNGDKNEILDRRSLTKGGFVWNVEDDDTKNLRLEDGKWVIRRRTKVIYTEQPKEKVDQSNDWLESWYDGTCIGDSGKLYDCFLVVAHWEHSGDGDFFFTYSPQEDSLKQKTPYEGKRFTLRGIPGDNDATVWQCITYDRKHIFNFLRKDSTQLIWLDKDFRPTDPMRKLKWNKTIILK